MRIDVGMQTTDNDDWATLVQTIPTFNGMPVALDLIDPNPMQPRSDFNQAEIEALAESIRVVGVIQAITVEIVYPSDDGGEIRYILHDGERRTRAARLAGLTEIPAIVLEPGADQRQLLIRATVANVQRADLNPIELARAYQKMTNMGLSDSEIAKQVGKSRSVVANSRRLLQLPEAQQDQVTKGALNERQALALLPLYQLPENAREKILDTYLGKELVKPEKLTSDEIRQRYNNAISYTGSQIEIINPDTPYTGEGIYHPTCTDCDCCVKKVKEMGYDLKCLNPDCLKLKQAQVKLAILEPASAATGLAYLDPGIDYKWDQTSGFYGPEGLLALQIAQEKHCPNLRLQYTNGNTGSGLPNIGYCCLHPGDSKNCLCEKAAEAQKKQAEKAKKAAIAQVKDQAAAQLAQFFREIPPSCLRAILYTGYRYENGKQDKIIKMAPEKLASELASLLIGQNVQFNEYRPLEASKNDLQDWLTKMGFADDGPAAKLADLDHRLAQIETYLADPPGDELFERRLVVVNGHLTDLAQIAEAAGPINDQKLLTRFDTAKRTLLTWREQIENLIALTTAPYPIGHKPAVPMKMYAHWSCGRCRRDFPPGERYWVTGHDKGVCAGCLTELQGEFAVIYARIAQTQAKLENASYTDLKDYRTQLTDLVRSLSPADQDTERSHELSQLLTCWEQLDDQLDDRIKNYQYKPQNLGAQPNQH